MKNLLKYILETIGVMTSLLFPQSIYNAIAGIKSHIYTGYRRRKFKSFGKTSLMASTVRLVNPQYISIGDNCEFYREVKLSAIKRLDCHGFLPEIIIGNSCQFGDCTHITAINSIKIGDNLLTGSNVLISDNSHGESIMSMLHINPQNRPLFSKGKVVIGNNVWLCNNVCVLSNVTIGNGAIVAANSVVTHDIPDNCIAAGVPAKIIKKIE